MPLPAGYNEPVLTPRAARAVEAAWTFEAQDTGTSIILPDGRCDVIIRRSNGLASAAITGPATRPYTVPHQCGDQWIGLRLRPGLGAQVWGEHFHNATNNALRADAALDRLPELRALLTPSLSANDIERGLFTMSVIRHARPCPRVLQIALDTLHLSGGRLQAVALARLCNVTPRHLNRLFQRHIGMATKTYAQLLRGHRAIALIRAGQLTLTQISLEAGYADQAHMCRDMRRFGGFTPSAMPANLIQPDIFV